MGPAGGPGGPYMGMGYPGGPGGPQGALAAQVAAQLAMQQGYYPGPNINAAAAAAAAAAVQNMMGACAPRRPSLTGAPAERGHCQVVNQQDAADDKLVGSPGAGSYQAAWPAALLACTRACTCTVKGNA